jgi:hypothetical protein
MDSITSDSALNNDDLIEEDNDEFVSQEIPWDVQLDTTTSVGKSHKKSPNEAVAEDIAGYMKVKEAEALNPRSMAESLDVELQTFMHAQSTMGKIELLEKQISVVTKRVENNETDEQRQRCSAVLEKIESKLDELILPSSK